MFASATGANDCVAVGGGEPLGETDGEVVADGAALGDADGAADGAALADAEGAGDGDAPAEADGAAETEGDGLGELVALGVTIRAGPLAVSRLE